jgi:amino acid adenylation domain-containing protein
LSQAPLWRAKLLRLGDEDHALILNFHHIICDGASWEVFYHELAEFYAAFLAGATPQLKPLAVQFADYTCWQQDWLGGTAADSHLDYWKRQLAGQLAALHLPADYDLTAVQTDRGGRRTKRLSKELTLALKELSRREGVTLFMTLLATGNVLLARLAGQNDIVVGSTIAGRTQPELEGLIGFFINALALRTTLSKELTFTELLQRVRTTCLDGYAHQEMPFERIVEELNPQRDFSRNPLFQVMFNLTDPAERVLTLAGCRTERIPQAAPSAKFDLVFNAPEVDGSIELSLVYKAGLFGESRIDIMLDQLGGLLEQIVSNPRQSIDRFSLVTPGTQACLPDPTAKLNDTFQGAIHWIISLQAQRQPERLAVVDAQESWSCGELDLRSNQLANCLISHGVQPGDLIAIYAHRSATLTLVLIGALKAGAVFVILDPAYPAARLREYLRIAKPTAWLQLELAGELPVELARQLDQSGLACRLSLPNKKERVARLLSQYAAAAPELPTHAETPAYIAFTSGSTGQPKGVIGRHGPMTHFLPWQQQEFGLTSNDRYCLLSGLAYNHLHRDIFTALATGATLYVPTADQVKDPEQLGPWMNRHKISILHMTPALGRLLRTGRIKLPTVRRIFFGGDALTRRDLAAMREIAANAKIVSFYGATETQRAVGYYSIPDDFARDRFQSKDRVPLGRGAKDVQLLVLASEGQLAGIGELGEIYIRSPHLAAGYLDDDLSAANFIANPFTHDPADRLYRTGEFGRYLPDGNVEWAGRGERRASIRGFRVELAELEAALLQHPAVREVAVVAYDDKPPAADPQSEMQNSTGQRLAAYIVAGDGEAKLAAELRTFLAAKLPHYMVPSHFQLMERLPLGPNGKVDYSGLPQASAFTRDSEDAFEPPRTETEQKLAQIFAEVLGVARIGRQDDFFHLGGHSLLAAQAATRIRQALSINLDLRSFMESPTVEALGKRLESFSAVSARGAEDTAEDREEIEL